MFIPPCYHQHSKIQSDDNHLIDSKVQEATMRRDQLIPISVKQLKNDSHCACMCNPKYI